MQLAGFIASLPCRRHPLLLRLSLGMECQHVYPASPHLRELDMIGVAKLIAICLMR
jgi:hypothetical protein